ncbi:hypothetical protein R1sor_007171 [Riccia sorocarpa]|uniref:BPL/LPL catalytic domain-containing protein n=1 Tax=Riccia sorocarpa TaxID=122646 RepID=A0ABD3HTC0_9MARC
MFSKTFTKLRCLAAIADSRESKLSRAADFWRGDRNSRVKRLETLSLHSMDLRNHGPVEKHPEGEEVSGILCSLSLGELGNSAVRQGDLGRVEAGKVGEIDKTPDVGKSLKEVGKVEALQGDKCELNATRADCQAADQLGKLESRKAGKIEEVERSANQVGKLGAGCTGKTEGQYGVGENGGHDAGKSQNKVGKVEFTRNITRTLERGQQLEDNAPGKLDLQVAVGAGGPESPIRGKIEEIVERSKSELPGKHSVGKNSTGKTSSDMSQAGGVFHKAGNENDSRQAAGMEAVKSVIFLEGKLPSHADLIHALSGNGDLKLPGGAVMLPLALSESTGAKLRELFDTSLYLQNLRASEFGAFVLYSPVIPSTHTLLSQNFHTFPQGTICIAGAQLQGKGRAGNVWESPKGCLMFSFTIKMTSGRLLPFLQYVVSLAVIEGLEEACNTKVPAPEVRIKWPNDLYAKGLKIGGVLCTSTYSSKTFNIVVGVGLNVGNREPTTCLDALIQELDPRAANLRQEELLAFIMSRFEELNGKFSVDGFSPLQEAYYSRWLHSGQTVTLEEKDPTSSEVSHVPVTIRGLTPSGYLLATDEQGEQYELHPDGNSFDFLKGLVRSKLSS